jgi:EamA domain-containing membrane protein RarD
LTKLLRAELLRKKMDMTKAAMRVEMSTVITPAYMRLMVAQRSAMVLATRNASKEYLLASSGVPAHLLLVLYPPGNWKAAANEIVMMSTDTTPMVVVESWIFFASSFAFNGGACAFTPPC